ncbi:MAG: hypothetical protein HS108_14385 [Planctomycetes bacterium]|nr:hypothetical protein [Planctomycetota bacterium]
MCRIRTMLSLVLVCLLVTSVSIGQRRAAPDEDAKALYQKYVHSTEDLEDREAIGDLFYRVDPSQVEALVAKDIKSKDEMTAAYAWHVASRMRLPGLGKDAAKSLGSPTPNREASRYALESGDTVALEAHVKLFVKECSDAKTAGTTSLWRPGARRVFLPPKGLDALYVAFKKKALLDNEASQVTDLSFQVRQFFPDRAALEKGWSQAKKRYDAAWDAFEKDPLRGAEFDVGFRVEGLFQHCGQSDACCHVTPDGKFAVFACRDSRRTFPHLIAYDTATGSLAYQVKHEQVATVKLLGPTYLGDEIAFETKDGQVYFDCATGSVTREWKIPSNWHDVYLTPDGTQAVAFTSNAGKDAKLLYLEPDTLKEKSSVALKAPSGKLITGGLLSPDGTRLCVADLSDDKRTLLSWSEYDAKTGDYIKTLSGSDPTPAAWTKTGTGPLSVGFGPSCSVPGNALTWCEETGIYGESQNCLCAAGAYQLAWIEKGNVVIAPTLHGRVVAIVRPDFAMDPLLIKGASCSADATVVAVLLHKQDNGNTRDVQMHVFKRK